MKRVPLVARVLALGAAALGCGGVDGLDVTFESAPPDDVVVSFDRIELHVGIAVGVTVAPREDGEPMDAATPVELVSRDPSVLEVAPGVPDPPDPEAEKDDEPPPNRHFVLVGVAHGSTHVLLRVDGDDEKEIPATVEPQ